MYSKRSPRFVVPTPPRTTLLIGSLAAATLMLWSGMAIAHPLDLYGAGARGSAMANVGAGAASDHAAVYYNPAAMTLRDAHMGAGFTTTLDDVHIEMKDRPAGYDLPDLGSASAKIPSGDRLQPRTDVDDIPDLYGFALGAVGSFGLKNLRIGVHVLLPVDKLGRQVSRFPDEREQYFSNRLDFEMIGERSQHQVIMIGIAYRLYPWLSLGGGMSVMPSITTTSQVYIDDPAKQERIELALETDQVGRAAPTAGVLVGPFAGLTFAAAYRGANFLRMEMVNRVQIRGFEGDQETFPVEQRSTVIVAYSPDQYTVGASWRRGRLLLAADLLWSVWFNYVNHQGNTQHEFNNTLSTRVGGEYRTSGEVLFRFGLGWEPSPVPDQVGRTNYVDNDRLVASIGAGHDIELLGRQVTLSWYLQLHHLLAKEVDKERLDPAPTCAPGVGTLCDEIADDTLDQATGQPIAAYQGLQTGNPGFPGWLSFGNLLAFGVELGWGL